MTRRGTPQRAVDERAFPIRVKVRAPNTDFAHQLGRILAWLRDEVGAGEFGYHAGGPLGPDALAFYFRELEEAARFLEAFPQLQLADGTGLRA